MKRMLTFFPLWLAGLVLFATPARSVVEWQTARTVSVDEAFVDLAASPDGQWTFVLTGEGDVRIYTAAGDLADTIHVGGSFDAIASAPRGDKLYLSNRAAGTVQIVELEFVQQIDISGSPSRGDADATVAIVVFEDFQ